MNTMDQTEHWREALCKKNICEECDIKLPRKGGFGWLMRPEVFCSRNCRTEYVYRAKANGNSLGRLAEVEFQRRGV